MARVDRAIDPTGSVEDYTLGATRKTLLLVEDEAIIALAERAQLQNAGYNVVHVTTGERAVETVAREPDSVDLILMDIDLGPGIDGTEAAERILAQFQLPIVFLSSHTEREYVEKTDRISSYGYVAKNSGEMVLLRSITMAFRLYEANRELKHQNLEAAAAEHRYHLMFENMMGGFALHEMIYDEQGRPVDYRFLDVNPAFERLTGLSAATVVGRTVKELLPGTEQYWIDSYARVVETGVPVAYENYSRELERYFDVWAYAHDPGIFAVVMNDVTERTRVRRQLRERTAELNERVRELHCLYEISHLSVDAGTSLPTLLSNIVKIIPSGFCDPETVCATVVVDDTHYRSADRSSGRQTISAQVVVNGSVAGTVAASRCAGARNAALRFLPEEQRLLEAIAEQIARLVHASAITAELRRSEERFRLLAENAQDLIFRFELVPERRFSYVSPSAARIVGYFPQEHYDDPDLGFKLIHPEDRHLLQQMGHDPAAMTAPVVLRWVRKDGETIWVEQSIVPIFDDKANVIAIEGIARDITQRKRDEQELNQHRQYLSTMLDSIGDAFIAVDLDARVVRMNPVAEQLTGWQRAEAVGRPLQEVFNIVNVTTRLPALNPVTEVLRTGAIVGLANHTALLKRGGGEFQIADSAAPIRDQTGNTHGVVLVFRDVSDEYRLRQELEGSERFLQNVFESVQEGISVLGPDLTIKQTNNAVERWFPDEQGLVGKKCYEVYRGREAPCEECPAARSIASGRPEHGELHGYVNAPQKWIEAFAYPMRDPATGEVTGVVEFMRDVTEKREADRAVAESEWRLKMALANTEAGVWDWDMSTDVVTYSWLWKAILGYTDEEMESSFSGWKELWHPDDAPVIQQCIDDHLAGKSERYEVVHRLRHKNGSWRWVMTRGAVLRDETGEVYRWIGTNVDITTQKQAEQELRLALENNRLLMRELQHRVKNNLAMVSGLFGIEMSKLSDPAAPKVLEDAQQRLSTIAALYEQLYLGDRVDKVELGSYLDGILTTIEQTLARDSVTLQTSMAELQTDTETAVVVGLITNELVTNALKYAYAENGGVVQVRLEVENEKTARLVVTDRGIGVPEGVSFDHADSTGVQLIRALTEQIGGTRSTDSSNGTRISIEFPCGGNA